MELQSRPTLFFRKNQLSFLWLNVYWVRFVNLNM